MKAKSALKSKKVSVRKPIAKKVVKRKTTKLISASRVNKNPKTHKNYFITLEHSEYGKLYYDGVGFSKLKGNAAIFHSKEQVVKVARNVSDLFKSSVKVEFD